MTTFRTFIIIYLIVFLTECRNKPDDEVLCKTIYKTYTDTLPSNFNFDFDAKSPFPYSYLGSSNRLTKHIYYNSDTSIDFQIDKIDLGRIYFMMKKMNILSYPEIYKADKSLDIRPSGGYSLVIRFNGITKRIVSRESDYAGCSERLYFDYLIHVIDSTISSNSRFKKLPKTKFRWL